MRSTARFAAPCLLASLAALVASAPAGAARKPITGQLSQPGYTVIAVAGKAKVKSVRARDGSFRLRPQANAVTLHLRAADGIYAGPIVVGGARSRALVGVKQGAALGSVDVQDGYARVASPVRSSRLDRSRYARARDGVPIGAGVFGRVRSRPRRGAVPGDLDIDGIPNRLDIDDDGDLVLDKVDRSRRARAAQDAPRDPFDLATSLGGVPLERTANVNAGSTDAQIATVLPDFGFMSLGWPSSAVPQADSVELDCGGTPNPSPPPPLVGGLSYCSYDGTGRLEQLEPPRDEFPECCDADGDGYGSLEEGRQFGPDFVIFHLNHGAMASEIGTGDTIILRLTSGGQETQLVDTQQFIFATTPALASFRDDAGNTTVVPYPVQEGEPGTFENGFPVSDGSDADSDVELTVTLWRPQRRPTAEQECVQPPAPGCTENEWIDVGGLDYTASSREGQRRTNDAGWCTQGDFSSSDPNLVAGFPDPQGGGFRDRAPSQAPSQENTLTYTVNLTNCLQAFGIGFARGDTQLFGFEAFTPIQGSGSAGVDNAATHIAFTRR